MYVDDTLIKDKEKKVQEEKEAANVKCLSGLEAYKKLDDYYKSDYVVCRDEYGNRYVKNIFEE
jgi:hypothetical protein